MIHSPRRHSSSGQGKHSLFPGAKAKNKDGLNNKSPNADAEEGHASGGADDGESLVIAHEDGSIFSDSADSRPGSDKDDGRCYNSEEPIPAAPEPKLDWAGLEERKLALEDGRATVSSSLASGDEDEASEYEAPSPASDAQGMPAALSSRGPSRSSSRSGSGSSSRSGSDSGSVSSSFPGAVAQSSASAEPEVLLPPLSPWHKRLPTWKQMAASSTLALVLAVAALVVCLPCFKVASGDDASGLGLFSEVFSGVLDYGSGDRVFQGKDRLNILCLGIDYNRDEKGMGYTAGARSDTIFVVSVSPKGDILNVLSIPRDTQVFISDAVGYDKINAAYSIGGIDLAKEVVSRLLQIPIHNYIIVKVAGAAKMVDAVGGLQINVEKDMDYDDNWGQLHIHLRAGNQLLQGEQAVGYARFRMDEEGDRGRIRRQQQTMQALLQRLKDPIVILRIKGIIKAIKENVITDLSFLDMLELVTRYKDFDRKLMRTGTLVGDDAEVNGVSVIIPYETENRKIVAELFSNINTVSPENVQVEVLNGCGDEKLADAVAEELREKGFQVTQADADRQDYQVTRVMDRLGSVAMRTSIESTVRGCQYETYEISAERRGADITVIVGQDQASRMAKPAAPAQDETILIDTGSRTPKGYVDDGQGLSNEHTSMPFEDMDLPADSASGSGDNPGVFDSSSGADEDFPDITSLPVNTLPKAQPAPARAHSPASREEVAHPRSVPSAAHSAPAIPEPRAEEPAAPVAEPVAVPEPEPAPEPIPEPAYEPAQPEAAEPAEPAPDSPADDDAVLPAPVSL